VELGCALAQMIRCWIVSSEAYVQPQDNSCGIFGGQSGSWQHVLNFLVFPCQLSFHHCFILICHQLGLV